MTVAYFLFNITLVVNFLGVGFTSLQMRLVDVISSDVYQRGNGEPTRGVALRSASLYVARRWSPEIEVYRIGSKMTVCLLYTSDAADE